MSHSYRINKIVGNTCKTSEKKDKTNANKKLRRLVKVRIARQTETLPLLKELSNIWSFAKDGKHYWAGMTKKDSSK